jgi:GNAT superfamily N-acetyltransferase/O-methyltransferase involved in polyketide biosynthesis
MYTMSDRFTIPKSISKTAIDSLHAKLSAVEAGWLCSHNNNNNSSSSPDDDINILLDGYTRILQQIHDGIDDEGQSKRRRRQTPLVNAGYAARMVVMTFILEKWIDSVAMINKEEGGRINVVALGCGLDALGLWSRNVLDTALTRYNHHHHHAGNRSPKRLNVYEVDAWDNCMLKQNALEKSGILQACRTTNNKDDDTAKDSSFCVVIEGITNQATKKEDHLLTDYHLIAMDFRDVCTDNSLLKKALDTTGFDPTQPTIIISELVLAYIGYESANAILHSMTRDLLCGNECSMFACLEPMLPTQAEQQRHSGNKKLLSVKESYARDYASQFHEKLNRGNCNSSGADEDSSFHPLGSNPEKIIARLISCGFSMSSLDVASLRKAVATVACTRRLRANEPFDEHAALSLNLECYAVACAFVGSNNDGVRGLIPWIDQSLDNSSTTIKITAIGDACEDTLVGNLYSRVYTHLYKAYPAIHKMVKSALKTELAVADSTNDSSAIRNRFNAKGGEFWVAHAMESSEIVGCIGIRQRKTRECNDEDDKEGSSSPFSVVEYEVQRLAVDDKHRGKGIGKRLLNAAYEYALQRGSAVANMHMMERKRKKRASVKLWAVTPDILVTANNLYNAFGFVKEESFEGGLTMNVYCKECMFM